MRYLYTHILDIIRLLASGLSAADVLLAVTGGIGTPEPQPQKCSKLVSRVELSQAYMFLNWLSAALVGVGGSDCIG